MRFRVKLLAGLLAVGILALGGAGAYSYGQDYNLHRGFSQVVPLPRAGSGRLLSVSFYSRALHRRADYMVYLPPHYNPAVRYPVLYLLHGMPGQPHVFVTIANMDVRLDNQLSLGTVRPMILVYPDGRIGGSVYSDSEWANTSSGAFESYVIDVVHNVDHHFSTLPLRQDRVIGGFSAGAYGAINIALHHLNDFAGVQVWSGYFTQTRSGVFARASRAQLAYNSPLDYLAHVRRRINALGLRATMFVGRDDSSSVQLPAMARALTASGASVHSTVYPGGHDWSVWYPRLNAMLIDASRAMGSPPPHNLARGVAAHARRFHLATPPAAVAPALRPAAASRARTATPWLALVAVLAFAFLAAALINLGFTLQHRALARAGHGRAVPITRMLRDRGWLAGQGIGWLGFAGQIAAVALAPLTLVQAFAAGSLALSVPLAARLFGHRVARGELIAVGVISLALFTLPIGAGAGHGALRVGPLIGVSLLVLVLAALTGRTRAGVVGAAVAGACYGVADAAIKADALALGAHGPAALLSGWTLLAAATTFAGFLSFQSALARSAAVPAISVMTAVTALAALGLGIAAFGESLGHGPLAGALHAAAIIVVLVSVRPLVRRQAALAGAPEGTVAPATQRATPALRRPVAGVVLAQIRRAAAALGTTGLAVAAAITATGLLYLLRGLGAFALGPRVPDALPLLQLAGFDGQPLVRVLAAWLLTGAALGVLPGRRGAGGRALIVALAGVAFLLIASDASYALARNLRFGGVLLHRAPPLGPWLEGLLLAAGTCLPAGIAAARRRVRAVRPAGEETPGVVLGPALGH